MKFLQFAALISSCSVLISAHSSSHSHHHDHASRSVKLDDHYDNVVVNAAEGQVLNLRRAPPGTLTSVQPNGDIVYSVRSPDNVPHKVKVEVVHRKKTCQAFQVPNSFSVCAATEYGGYCKVMCSERFGLFYAGYHYAQRHIQCGATGWPNVSCVGPLAYSVINGGTYISGPSTGVIATSTVTGGLVSTPYVVRNGGTTLISRSASNPVPVISRTSAGTFVTGTGQTSTGYVSKGSGQYYGNPFTGSIYNTVNSKKVGGYDEGGNLLGHPHNIFNADGSVFAGAGSTHTGNHLYNVSRPFVAQGIDGSVAVGRVNSNVSLPVTHCTASKFPNADTTCPNAEKGTVCQIQCHAGRSLLVNGLVRVSKIIKCYESGWENATCSYRGAVRVISTGNLLTRPAITRVISTNPTTSLVSAAGQTILPVGYQSAAIGSTNLVTNSGHVVVRGPGGLSTVAYPGYNVIYGKEKEKQE